jgi:predicted AAA+ superfamily ATPase
MKRLIDQKLKNWAQKGGRKALLLRGARQVGKTYAVRELGKTFESYIEINLEFDLKARTFFASDLDPHRIAREIMYHTKKEIIPGKTLLFFDEVQALPQAITALRYFYEMMPDLHVIAAGSLLDFAIELVGVPVGRVEFLYMYPLSFIEFLEAAGEDILLKAVREHKAETAISEVAHDRLLKLVREYLAIGGMPEVVQTWVSGKNALRCFELQQALLGAYRNDFNKYAKQHQLKYLDLLFKNIPLQIGRKFKYSDVPGEYRKRELAPNLDLLVTARVVNKVYHTAAQGLPLGAQMDPADFKVIFLDVALAQVLLGIDITEWLYAAEDVSWVNKGPMLEAFVGQEILAYSNASQEQDLYYWSRSERTGNAEIDYVVPLQRQAIPIEVKSGSGTTLKSMHYFLQAHTHSSFGIRFSTQNYSVHDKIYSYPLYAIASALQKELL